MIKRPKKMRKNRLDFEQKMTDGIKEYMINNFAQFEVSSEEQEKAQKILISCLENNKINTEHFPSPVEKEEESESQNNIDIQLITPKELELFHDEKYNWQFHHKILINIFEWLYKKEIQKQNDQNSQENPKSDLESGNNSIENIIFCSMQRFIARLSNTKLN